MTAQIEIQQALSDALTSARIRNSAYSLRAFARRLEISPAALSEILNGKRRISKKLASRIIERLNLDPREAEGILRTFDSAGESRDENQSSADYVELDAQASVDHFAAIAEWQHFAILSLAETRSFKSDVAWIAERLGLRETVAAEAIERLLRLGLLKRSAKKLVPTGLSYSSPEGIVSRATRRAHAQFFELSALSLERHSIDERDFTGITMAIDPAKLPAAKKMIRRFRDRLCRFLEDGKKDDVFRLNIQLLPLSQASGSQKDQL